MRLTIRDALSTLFVAAIGVPYVGYLLRGEMPFIKDPRGMAATALVLGVAAFLAAGRYLGTGTFGKVQFGFAIATLALGVAAVVFAETFVAELLLAVFIATIGVLWAVKMLDHAGLIHVGSTPALGSRR